MKKQGPTICAILAMIAGFILAPNSVYAEMILKAHWSFEETGDDGSGNGHAATLKGGAAYSENAAEGSHSLSLSGQAYAAVGAFEFGETFTVTAWTFLNPGLSNIQTIIGNCEGGSRIDGFKLFVNNWETSNHCILVEASDGVDRTDVTSPENTFEEGFWNHVAMTADLANKKIEIFYNGERVSDPSLTTPVFQVVNPVVIGGMPPGNVYNWQGLIDDVRIYEGVLTQDEIGGTMNPLSVEEPGAEQTVADFRLEQNYPNPFNPVTTIAYRLPRAAQVSLIISDQTGRLVASLVEGSQAAGSYQVNFNAENLPSGIYFCRFKANSQMQVIKMMVVK